ncbi:hypothetical protein [Yersinia intermedia]|uniref:hypothetical protein n=1 Tax=Yersinia intermedia TaxID=631 RepID=UPI0039C759D7
MNDIEKLHQVIDTLEEQSSRVAEFNGVLSSVNSAKEQIETAKILLVKLADEQSGLISESYKRFDEYGLRLTNIESLATLLGDTQNEAIKEIGALEFVISEQHQQGRTTMQEAFAEQFATLKTMLDKFTNENDLRQTEAESQLASICEIQNKMINEIAMLAEKADAALVSHHSAIKSLRTIVVFGVLILASGIAFLAKNSFM